LWIVKNCTIEDNMTQAAWKSPFELIQDYEELFAHRLGREVIDKPEVSVWMILIPVLFVHHMYLVKKYKDGVRSFARGILDSRHKALDKAREEKASGQENQNLEAEAYFPDLDPDSQSDPALLSRQVQVMNILKKHYRRLLNAEQGPSYADLLQKAYPQADHYREFISRLSAAEQELNLYLTEHVHTSEEARSVVRRMEKCCADLREEEISFFYRGL
jgi:hypothetical protein